MISKSALLALIMILNGCATSVNGVEFDPERAALVTAGLVVVGVAIAAASDDGDSLPPSSIKTQPVERIERADVE